MENNAQFNPGMLTCAREAKGLTQKELSERLSITQGFLSKVETGSTSPSKELLARAATELNCTERFFSRWPKAWVPPLVLYRKQQKLGALHLRRIHAQILRKRIELERLLLSVEVPENSIPSVILSTSGWTPSRAALELRSQWQLARGPIPNVAALLESKGVVVVPMDFKTDLLQGISAPPGDGLPPMVFLNSRLPGDRARWTLGHELGHLVLHHHLTREFPADDFEDEANEFSSEFLMPANDISGHLAGLTLRSASDLKRRWGISMSALVMRAATLEQISESRKTKLFVELSRMGWRKKEPVEIAPEEPALHRDVLRAHLKDLGYSLAELAEAMDLPESELLTELGETRGALQLVRS